MKKIIYLSSLFVAVSFSVSAQDLSLHEALNQASSFKVNQSDFELKIQQIQKNIVKKQSLPVISGDLSLQRNLITPVTPVPSIAFDPSANPDQYTLLKFATDWNAKVGLQLNWDIFNPKTKFTNQQNQILVDKSNSSNQLAKINFKNDIVKIYAQAYLAQQQYQLAITKEQNYKNVLEIIKARVLAGRASKIDENNAVTKSIQLEMTRKEAAMVLYAKQLMLMNYFDVSKYDSFSTSISEILSIQLDQNNNLQQQLLEHDLKLKEYELNYTKQSNLPTISLNGYYGGQYFSNNLQLFNNQNWYGNSFIGLGIKIPVSNWLIYKDNIQKINLDYNLALSKFNEQVQSDNQKLTQKANDLSVLKEKINLQETIIKIAEENVQLAKYQLDEGKILITEYNTHLENLFEKNKQLWQLQYDLVEKILE